MTYTPITQADKQRWIDWLTDVSNTLNNKIEVPMDNTIFETPDGDVATGKDLVGNFLALLTNQPVTVN